MKREVHNFLTGKMLAGLLIGCILFIAPTIQAKSASSNINRKPEAISPVQEKIEVTGRVTDAETGEPLPGVNIAVQGTTTGTTTDMDGEYSIEAPEDATLAFSFVGYKRKKIEVNNRKNIDVSLQIEVTSIDKLVITGYEIKQKRDVSGSISKIDPQPIQSLPNASINRMLEGRVSGVQVLSDNEPGGGEALRIRGYSTINNNDPLYIIDGVPTTEGLNMIHPKDIASMQIMKDAAAASIYGSRAANGVVVVSTIKGQSEQPSVEFHAYNGLKQAYNLPDMLDSKEYGENLFQAIRNDGGIPSHDIYGDNPNQISIPEYIDDKNTVPSDNVDWVEQIFEPSLTQSYHLALSQGDDRVNQAFTLGYYNEDGIIKHTSFERFSGRFNSEYTLSNNISIGENLTASYSRRVDVTSNDLLGSVIQDSYQFPSIVPVKDNNGDFGGNPLNDTQNPMGKLYRNKDNLKKNVRAFGNIFGEVQLVEALNFRTNLGLDYQTFNFRDFAPEYNDILSQRAINNLSTQNARTFKWTWSNTLKFNKQLGNHKINMLLGQEAIHHYSSNCSASRQNFLYEDATFRYLDFGADNQQNSGNANEWSLNSYFVNLDYDYAGKYLASFTLRRDGTSRLSQNTRSIFPAFSLGWRLNEEGFFQATAFDEFKLRLSWGQVGNQFVPSYSTLSSYTNNVWHSNYAMNGQQEAVNVGLVKSRIANPNLKWETTTQTDVGLDIALFDNNLEITADYFQKITEDILIFSSVPSTYGGTNDGRWSNAGKMINKGVELSIHYRSNPKKEFRYQAGINLTHLQNTVDDLGDMNYVGLPGSVLHVINFDQEVSRTYERESIGSFYGYKEIGIFQSEQEVSDHGIQPGAHPGDLKFKDVNNDGELTPEDRTTIGSPLPDYKIGINLEFDYRNFDLNIFMNGVFGNDIYDLTRYKGDFFNQSAYNKYSRVNDAWSQNNKGSDIPRLSLDDPNQNIRPSSYYVKKGSYFKMNNVELGYSIPNNLLGNGDFNIRIYAQATNLLTISPYKGLTPEIGLQNYNSSYSNLDIGVDRGVYPPSRTYTLGLNIDF